MHALSLFQSMSLQGFCQSNVLERTNLVRNIPCALLLFLLACLHLFHVALAKSSSAFLPLESLLPVLHTARPKLLPPHSCFPQSMVADLIVPDDVETVPTAVKAAVHIEDGEEPVKIYVRKGLYKWEGDIFLFVKYMQDIQPMSRVSLLCCWPCLAWCLHELDDDDLLCTISLPSWYEEKCDDF